MKYKVNTRVFYVGGYSLKKGDIIEIVSVANDTVFITSEYFENDVETSMQEIEIHCEQI